MPFFALGVEHTTSPLPVREAVTMDPDAVAHATEALRRQGIDEVAILSTCNRTELYLFSGDVVHAAAVAGAYLTALHPNLDTYLRTWEEMDAAEHLFRVAAGLESLALGEAQILGQVRETLELGQELGGVGSHLHSLFRAAIACARQARAGTALGRVNVSIGSAAVEVAEQMLGDLAGQAVLVVGGGEISRLVAEELRARRAGPLWIANRTESVAVELAARYDGRPARLSDIPRIAPAADLIISATSAPRYVLAPEDLPGTAERAAPLLIFDLAMPRDVDPDVAALPMVRLRDLDALLPEGVLEHWSEDIRTMEATIAAEIKEFEAWYLTRRVVPVIAGLRAHVEAVSQQELKRVAPHLTDLTPRERAAVESLTQRLIDKMFHHLVTRLRLAAQSDARLVEAAEFFFLHGEGGLFEHAAQQSQETPAEITEER